MGAGVVSGRELGPGVQAAGQGMLDIWQFFLARLVQHEIGYRLRQAEERADPKRMNKGGGATEACLKMIELRRHFRLTSKRRWVAR